MASFFVFGALSCKVIRHSLGVLSVRLVTRRCDCLVPDDSRFLRMKFWAEELPSEYAKLAVAGSLSRRLLQEIETRVALDKSEGGVKDKNILSVF
jgi:hypothetical protein